MSDFNDTEFDRKIRSLLENAEEEVPDRVWDTISGQLDKAQAAKKKKAVLPWLCYAGTAAAAAAVALTVFFNTGNPDRQPGVIDISQMSAQAGLPDMEQTQEQTQVEEPEPVQTVSATSAKTIKAAPEKDEAETYTDISEPEDTTVKKETAVTDEEGSQSGEDSITRQIRDAGADTYTAEAWPDPFAEDENPKGDRIHTAITISGLASTNNRTSTAAAGSRPMMSSGKPGTESRNPITENPGTDNYAIPLSFGVGAKVIFTPRWSLGAGLNYSLLSRTFSGTYTEYSANGIQSVTPYSKIRNVQSYIGIPVNVYFSIMKNRIVDLYAYAGGTAEKCIINRYTIPGKNIVHNEKVQGFQFSVDAGIGVEFIIADMLGIYVDPSLRYYIPDSRQPKSIRTVQPLMLGFEMGFRVRL